MDKTPTSEDVLTQLMSNLAEVPRPLDPDTDVFAAVGVGNNVWILGGASAGYIMFVLSALRDAMNSLDPKALGIAMEATGWRRAMESPS